MGLDGIDWFDEDLEDTEEEESEVDTMLERWLAGEDVSLDDIWESWDEKYADEETYVKDDDA